MAYARWLLPASGMHVIAWMSASSADLVTLAGGVGSPPRRAALQTIHHTAVTCCYPLWPFATSADLSHTKGMPTPHHVVSAQHRSAGRALPTSRVISTSCNDIQPDDLRMAQGHEERGFAQDRAVAKTPRSGPPRFAHPVHKIRAFTGYGQVMGDYGRPRRESRRRREAVAEP